MSGAKWRVLFDNKEYHRCLNVIVRHFFAHSLGSCYENGAIDGVEMKRAQNAIELANVYDLSDTKNLLNMRFQSIYSPKDIGISRILYFIARDNASPAKVSELVHDYSEFDGIVRYITMFRNAWSHHRNIQNERVWCLLLHGLLMRLQEITNHSDLDEEISTIQQLAYTLAEYKNPSEAISSEVPVEKDTFKESIGDRLEKIESSISRLSTQISQQPNLLTDEPSDEADDLRQIDVPDAIEVQLYKIRNQIEYENESNVDYPGPAANILQSSIINEIIEFKPRTLERFQELPEFLWAFKKNQTSMLLQIQRWGDTIQSVLNKLN